MKGKKITISFKATTKDMEIYELLMAEEEKSDVVKEALRQYYNLIKRNREGDKNGN